MPSSPAPAPTTTPAAPATAAAESMKDAPPVAKNPEIEKLIHAGKEKGATPEATRRSEVLELLRNNGASAEQIALIANAKVNIDMKDTADSLVAKAKEVVKTDEDALIADFGKLLHEAGDPKLLTLALAIKATNATPLGRQLRREAMDGILTFQPDAKAAPDDPIKKRALELQKRSESIVGNHDRLYKTEDQKTNALYDFAQKHETDFGGKENVKALRERNVEVTPTIGEIMGQNSTLARDLFRELSGNPNAEGLPLFTPETILGSFGYTESQIPEQKTAFLSNLKKVQDAYKAAMTNKHKLMAVGHHPELGGIGMGLCGTMALFMLLSQFMSEGGGASAPSH